MQDLARLRCHNHRQREAAACCPECRRYFCRECVTEHKDRVLCAACLKNSGKSDAKHGSRFARIKMSALTFCGWGIMWLFFYGLGRILILIPAEFHEGTLWK